MAKITTDLIKEIKAKTDVGLSGCKKALEEAEGDFDKALKLLAKKGAKIFIREIVRTNEDIAADISKYVRVPINIEELFKIHKDVLDTHQLYITKETDKIE